MFFVLMVTNLQQKQTNTASKNKSDIILSRNIQIVGILWINQSPKCIFIIGKRQN